MTGDFPLWLGWLVAGIGLLGTFLISAYESAIFSLRSDELRNLLSPNNEGQKWLASTLERPHNLAMALLLQRNLGIAVTTAGFLWSYWLTLAGLHQADWFIFVTGGLLAALGLIFGTEIVPNALAARYRTRIIRSWNWPFQVVSLLLRPLVGLLNAISRIFFHKGGYEGIVELVLERELEGILGSTEEVETLEEEEREMLENIIEMRQTTVREVMVPRVDMHCLEANLTLDEVIAHVRKIPHSRIPVYREAVDNIIGILHVRELFVRMAEVPPPSLADLTRKPYFIPESKMVDELMADMKRTKTHLALVVDEYGGIAGLVTLEDLLEEIVGEIHDEFDTEEPLLTRVDAQSWLASGKLPIEDLNARLDLALPDTEYDTLSGFIYEQSGAIPTVGMTVEEKGVRFIVEDVVGHRLTRIRIVLPPEHVVPEE